jgi:hypothetical protein
METFRIRSRYWRVVFTIGGTTPSFTFVVVSTETDGLPAPNLLEGDATLTLAGTVVNLITAPNDSSRLGIQTLVLSNTSATATRVILHGDTTPFFDGILVPLGQTVVATWPNCLPLPAAGEDFRLDLSGAVTDVRAMATAVIL